MSINGKDLHALASELFPLCRSVSSPENYQTLEILKEINASMVIKSHEVGKQVFDWKVPKSWQLIEAKISDLKGKTLISTNTNNLHVVNFSQNFEGVVEFAELEQHLYFDEQNYEAIPYVTSYYAESWGMCVSKRQYDEVLSQHSRLNVSIKVKFRHDLGMPYGEIVIPGKTQKEILLTTYICHPSMANNELSGPVIAIYLSRVIKDLDNYYSYRIIFVTETIGAIAYISENLSLLQERVIAGYVLTCLGDEGEFSYMLSPDENSLSDQLAEEFFMKSKIKFKKYSFLERGSDERQFNAHPLHLGIGNIMRTKYGEYRQYHTSLDDLSFITKKGLKKSLETLTNFIDYIENQKIYVPTVYLEPMMGKRGLFSNISRKGSQLNFLKLVDVIAYSNGKRSTREIAKKIHLSHTDTLDIISLLLDHDLLVKL